MSYREEFHEDFPRRELEARLSVLRETRLRIMHESSPFLVHRSLSFVDHGTPSPVVLRSARSESMVVDPLAGLSHVAGNTLPFPSPQPPSRAPPPPPAHIQQQGQRQDEQEQQELPLEMRGQASAVSVHVSSSRRAQGKEQVLAGYLPTMNDIRRLLLQQSQDRAAAQGGAFPAPRIPAQVRTTPCTAVFASFDDFLRCRLDRPPATQTRPAAKAAGSGSSAGRSRPPAPVKIRPADICAPPERFFDQDPLLVEDPFPVAVDLPRPAGYLSASHIPAPSQVGPPAMDVERRPIVEESLLALVRGFRARKSLNSVRGLSIRRELEDLSGMASEEAARGGPSAFLDQLHASIRSKKRELIAFVDRWVGHGPVVSDLGPKKVVPRRSVSRRTAPAPEPSVPSTSAQSGTSVERPIERSPDDGSEQKANRTAAAAPTAAAVVVPVSRSPADGSSEAQSRAAKRPFLKRRSAAVPPSISRPSSRPQGSGTLPEAELSQPATTGNQRQPQQQQHQRPIMGAAHGSRGESAESAAEAFEGRVDEEFDPLHELFPSDPSSEIPQLQPSSVVFKGSFPDQLYSDLFTDALLTRSGRHDESIRFARRRPAGSKNRDLL